MAFKQSRKKRINTSIDMRFELKGNKKEGFKKEDENVNTIREQGKNIALNRLWISERGKN